MKSKKLSEYKTSEYLHNKNNTDPDLKNYIGNQYVTQLIYLLTTGIGEAVKAVMY